MRRHSEIPNTPTPLTRGGDLKVGTLVSIPNTGRAILKFVGSVEGKQGKFAGIELLGESAALGKNSGDVNGVQYFTTSTAGAGLFIPYEKLLSTADGIESPRNNRGSVAGPPGGIRFNQTPSRQTTRPTQPPYSKRPSVITRQHNSTPPLTMVSNLSSKTSPAAEREIQRLLNIKIVIENERDHLLQEVDDLKGQLRGAHDRLDENENLLRQLQTSYNDAHEKLERADERVAQAENKLLHQRRVYEEQRRELLEVIDQVESQVNDNEQLYIGELKKLQEELHQKQEIIVGIQLKLKNLENLYEKQKGTTTQVGDQELDHLHGEIQNLKLTNLTQAQAIQQLREDVKQREGRLTSISKESLELKEAHITDKTNMEIQIKEQKYSLEKLQVEISTKENELIDLHEELRVLREQTEDVTRDIGGAEDIDQLKKQHNLKIQEMASKIDELNDRFDLTVSKDKFQELEFKLENKESMIADLTQQLIEEQQNNNNDDNVPTREQLESLEAELEKNSNFISELEAELKEWKMKGTLLKNLEDAISSKDLEINQCRLLIEEKNLLLVEQEERITTEASANVEKIIAEKEEIINTAKEDIAKLTAELEDALKDKEQSLLILSEQDELQKALESKEEEIKALKLVIEEKEEEMKLIKVEYAEPEKFSESPELEEKILENEILKEEISIMKGTNSQKEIESLKDELSSLKKLNRHTTNRELLEQIQLLQKEIARRPTTDEVQQLRSELELVEQLRVVEAKSKDKEIYQLKQQLHGGSQGSAPGTPLQFGKDLRQIGTKSKSHIDARTSPVLSPISMNRPSVISQIVDGSLQVYVPEGKHDPGNGRKQWCGLCERDGHDSIDCPYENDIF